MDWKTDYESFDDFVMDPCVHCGMRSNCHWLSFAAVEVLVHVSMGLQLLKDLYPRPEKHLKVVCTSLESEILMRLGEVLA